MASDPTATPDVRVEIVSLLAAAKGAVNGMSWTGTIPLSLLGVSTQDLDSNPQAVNGRLWRLFNPVEPADSQLLGSLGYRLPSLSAGDLIAWEGVTWRAATLGFERMRAAEVALAAIGSPPSPSQTAPSRAAQFMRDVRALVDYSWPDEERDYEQQDHDARDGHVFQALTRVDTYQTALGID